MNHVMCIRIVEYIDSRIVRPFAYIYITHMAPHWVTQTYPICFDIKSTNAFFGFTSHDQHKLLITKKTISLKADHCTYQSYFRHNHLQSFH